MLVTTKESFLSEERTLRSDLEQEYTVFLDMPEMHPYYEDVLELFARMFARQPDGDDDKVWMKCWKKKLDHFKEQEWKIKRKALIEKHEQMKITAKSRTENTKRGHEDIAHELSENSSMDDNCPPFCVGEALSYLEKVQDTVGVLAPPLRRLVRLAREAGTDTGDAMRVVTSSDNAALLRLCQDKLARQVPSAPSHKALLLRKASKIASQLIDHAQLTVTNFKIAKERLENIDLKTMAKGTLGMAPADVIKVIKTKLGFEFIDFIAKEDFNNIFTKISSFHFKMAIGHCLDNEKVVTHGNRISPATQDITESEIPMSIKQPKNPVKRLNLVKIPNSDQASIIKPTSDHARLTKIYGEPLLPFAHHNTASQRSLDTSQHSCDTLSPLSRRHPSLTPPAQNGPLNSAYGRPSPPPLLQTSTYSPSPPSNIDRFYSPAQLTTSSGGLRINSTFNRLSSEHVRAKSNETLKPTGSVMTSSDSWFVNQINEVMRNSDITVKMFNKSLCSIFANKRPEYEFTSRDLSLASNLQQLTSLDLSENMFIISLKKILSEV